MQDYRPTALTHSEQGKLSYWTRVLPVRSELHLARKAWHALTGMVLVALYLSGIPQSLIITLLGALFVFNITMEVLRLKNPQLNDACIRFFGPIIRSNEVNRVSGMPYYTASAIIAMAFFPKDVAVLSLLFLAIGDPVASLFGVLYSGKSVKIFEGKSLHGTAAGFFACAMITCAYLRASGMHGLDVVRLSLLGGFAGALSELLPLELDDNFTIPVVSGFIMWIGFIMVQFV